MAGTTPKYTATYRGRRVGFLPLPATDHPRELARQCVIAWMVKDEYSAPGDQGIVTYTTRKDQPLDTGVRTDVYIRMQNNQILVIHETDDKGIDFEYLDNPDVPEDFVSRP